MANKEALRQLRRVVEGAPEHQFHMNRVVDNTDCGTARCAIGWAVVDKWFQKNTSLVQWIDPKTKKQYILPSATALAQIFGIPTEDVSNLFGGDLNSEDGDPHSVSKQEVLWNIDALLAGRDSRPYRATFTDWGKIPPSERYYVPVSD